MKYANHACFSGGHRGDCPCPPPEGGQECGWVQIDGLSVCLSCRDGCVPGHASDHPSWVHPALATLMSAGRGLLLLPCDSSFSAHSLTLSLLVPHTPNFASALVFRDPNLKKLKNLLEQISHYYTEQAAPGAGPPLLKNGPRSSWLRVCEAGGTACCGQYGSDRGSPRQSLRVSGQGKMPGGGEEGAGLRPGSF